MHKKITQISSHKDNLIALSEDGFVYCWKDKWVKMPALPTPQNKHIKNCPTCYGANGHHETFCKLNK